MLEIWNDFPNSKIACGYEVSHRVAQKVIENESDNTFLGKQKARISMIFTLESRGRMGR